MKENRRKEGIRMKACIIVDVNEAVQSPEIVSRLSKRLLVEKKPLVYGDYLISPVSKKGIIGIERKRLQDLAQSIIDGRLWQQVTGLVENYDHAVLLLEGSPWAIQESPVLMGAYVTLTYAYKTLKIVNTYDFRGTVRFLERTVMYSGKTGSWVPPIVRKEHTPDRIKESMLCCVRGLNMRHARLIWKKAGSWEGLLGMKKEEFQNIKGIGKVIADRIYRSLHEPYGGDRNKGKKAVRKTSKENR